MKHIKKVVTLLLAAVMVLAMSATVFAEPTSGSVTVNPNYKDQTYTLYKLFDAQITFNEDNTQRAITYTLPADKTLEAPATDWFKVNSNGFVEATEALTADVMKSAAFRTWVKDFGEPIGDELTATSNNDANVKWSGLAFGYYFVDSTLGALVGVDSDNPNVTIQDKNNPPSIDKEITGVNGDTSSLGVGDNATDPGEGKNEKAIAQVGDPVSYKLTVKIKPGAENYVVTDTLSAGLTPPVAGGVTVSAGADNCTVDVSGQVITVTFKQTYLDTITDDTDVTITYTAVLNNSAVIGADGNDNTAKLTWGHSPDDKVNYSEDDAKVYTAQVEVMKKDDSGKPLEEAGFVVKNSDNKYYKLDNGVVTWVDSIDSADEHMSGADGKVAPFTGLKNGTYTLIEKTVPYGFNKLEDTSFTIEDTDYTNTNLKQTKEVTNKAGAVLPSTGGIGTVIFYVLGSMLVIGCGIVLISRRRMNANK